MALITRAPVPRPRAGVVATAALFLVLAAASAVRAQLASQPAPAARPAPATVAHDGRRDFDWDLGVWKIHQRRLLRPLTGSRDWVEYDGVDTVRRLWDGADTATIETAGPAGHLDLFSLRLYDPQSRQWSISFASRSAGAMGPPSVGEFKDGRGDFYDQETINGRAAFVRFSVSDITPTSCRFEQAFSTDGGKTWEVNLIVDETRVTDAA
jgi:hypothetical protein